MVDTAIMVGTPEMYEIEKAYLVGKGPSLRGFDLEQLRDKYTIGLNSASFVVPDVDAIAFVDPSFYKGHKDFVDNFKGKVFAARSSGWHTPTIAHRDMRLLTGIFAIHCALTYCKNIYLLGYDLVTTIEYPYFLDEFAGNKDRERFERMDGGYRLFYDDGSFINRRLKVFDEYFSMHKDRIFNCNPKSAIKTFDFIKFEDTL